MRPDARRALLALSALLSTLCGFALLGIVLLPRPFDVAAVMSGAQALPADGLATFKRQVALDLTLDSAYLLSSSVVWCGYWLVVSQVSRYLANVAFLAGLASIALDFAENELRWSATRTAQLTGHFSAEVGLVWSALVGLSYWALVIAALLTGAALATRSTAGRLLAMIAGASLVAAPMMYLQGLLPIVIWLVAWHFCSAMFLAIQWKDLNAARRVDHNESTAESKQ